MGVLNSFQAYFKASTPRLVYSHLHACNSIWYDYDVVYEALSEGRLYEKDSKLLKKASGTDLSEEVISPVHRLGRFLLKV